ncbi:porin family protein [Herminiimonas fonticola]|uniref:OOP family OmpA-OmpF porin n=1 Tax=Herminiimonas fonticola TaxID=303380 RepID=A0A4R6GHH7_9BURK|nr:porin family protein [Herminiimonas fonticola]RBA24684.1 Outer membrane protein beta-barrel domain [Herminiimonas fonticola]TDN93800.1 OOP family OmpA-OmpF porin [Herminiimonas fonticola]
MKQALLVAVLGMTLSVPVIAYADGAYVGLNAGRTDQKVFAEGISGTAKDTTTGYKLYGGYDFNKNFGVEGGYMDSGDGKAVFSNGFFVSGKTTSLYVAATSTLPLSEQFSVFAKAGVATSRAKLHNSVGDYFDERTTSPVLGIGAAYAFNKNIALVIEYENFGKSVKIENDYVKTELLSVGLRYKF